MEGVDKMVEVFEPFPLKVFKISTSNWSDKQAELLKLVAWDDPLIKGGYQISDYHKNVKEGCPYVKEFCDTMSDELTGLLEATGSSNLHITDMWAQRYFRQDYMPVHSHGPIGYSAVLYTEFDPKEHSGTSFISPFHSPSGELEYYDPEVKEGDLLVFPSQLMHDAKPSNSDKQRTIFSFNFEFRK